MSRAATIGTGVLVILICCRVGFALKPEEILVIANRDITASVQTAQYYCAKRKVPAANIFALPLGRSLSETISRGNYEKRLAEPIRRKLSTLEFAGRIRCLLTTYGVPIKVGGRGLLKGQEDKLRRLEKLVEQLKSTIEKIEQSGSVYMLGQKEQANRRIAKLQSEIDRIKGKETNASVDSELSMVLFGDYELYRWQPNLLKNSMLGLGSNTLMVSRLMDQARMLQLGLLTKQWQRRKRG